jgi:hypothetical protein
MHATVIAGGYSDRVSEQGRAEGGSLGLEVLDRLGETRAAVNVAPSDSGKGQKREVLLLSVQPRHVIFAMGAIQPSPGLASPTLDLRGNDIANSQLSTLDDAPGTRTYLDKLGKRLIHAFALPAEGHPPPHELMERDDCVGGADTFRL